jgi:DNA-binding NtrC family response regulator
MQNRDVRVFVVDDEPMIASTLTDILRLSGFDATGFTNPLVALEAAKQAAPNLLISDVAMPELSGIELAMQLKAMNLNCNILLFSGHSATYDLLGEARARGFDFQILSKPLSPRNLIDRLSKIQWQEIPQA